MLTEIIAKALMDEQLSVKCLCDGCVDEAIVKFLRSAPMLMSEVNEFDEKDFDVYLTDLLQNPLKPLTDC